mmetsp:Transcript_2205/g.4929  ORF Transcript_2205/g.4929 Transcript_2205/m.4929 type:complete len:204 (-) Transcript_2205:905-1516(-)
MMPQTYTAEKPATTASQTYSTMAVVTRAPRDAGDRKPRVASSRVTTAVVMIWTPEPTCTARDLLLGGARKTSPLTSFQPASSFMSRLFESTTSCSYFARSRRTVRIRIRATMVAMTSTTSSEFMMLNQCTLPPGILRYASQRDAHFMSLSSQYTSYVYTILAPSTISCAGMCALLSTPHTTSSGALPGSRLMLHGDTSKPTTM